MRNELVIIQSGLADYDNLIQNLQKTASEAGHTLSIVMLDDAKEGVAQIDAALAGIENLDAIHFVTHGADGRIQLGSTLLSWMMRATYCSMAVMWLPARTDSS